MAGFFVTGTDTDVGKSVAAAWLTLKLDAQYWKPVQSGDEGGTDKARVLAMTGLPPERAIQEAYVLPEPLSPHEAAKRAGVKIDTAKLALPEHDGFIVVEGAGGLMVPINETALMIDLAAQLGLPVVLVARSSLGTINHTLLSLEAMRARGLAIAGVVMSGEKSPHNREAIETYGKVQVIAEIPLLETIDAASLRAIEPELDLAALARRTL